MSHNLARISLRFKDNPRGLGVSKSISTAGIEFVTMLEAPVGEFVAVDVRFDDQVALANESLASLFSKILPLQESAGQDVTVDEHGFQTIIVRFVIPNHSDRLNLGG